MARGLITDTILEDIADAIRAKLGTQNTYTPAQFANAVRRIGGLPEPSIVSFADGSDAEIAAMIEYAHEYPTWSLQTDGGWSVGDVRRITIASFTGGGKTVASQDVDIMITSFDEYEGCGNVLQFDFKNALNTGLRLATANDQFLYGSSEMKTTTLPALVDALPTYLKNMLCTFNVKCCVSDRYTLGTVSGNKLALRSTLELGGGSPGTKAGQGVALSYYATQANRVKKYGVSGSAADVWTRSTHENSNRYLYMESDGSFQHVDYANAAKGVAPFGCL